MALQLARVQAITLLRTAEILVDSFCESSLRTRLGDLGSRGLVGPRVGLGDHEAHAAQALAPRGTWEWDAGCSSLLTRCLGGRRGLRADDVYLAGPPPLLSCSLKCVPPTPVLGLVYLVGPGEDFYPDSTPPGLWKTLHPTRPPAPSNGS
jgi:hypothetical protein